MGLNWSLLLKNNSGSLPPCSSKAAAEADLPDQTAVNWLDLPDHILLLITSKFIHVVDFIRFGAVCHSWQSVYVENLTKYPPPPQPPLLMCNTDHDIRQDHTRRLYSFRESKLSNFRVRLPHYKSCRGSSRGWLITVDNKNYTDVTLYNPFNNNQIDLPPMTAFTHQPPNDMPLYREFYTHRAPLSADPMSNPRSFVVMAIHGGFGKLSLFKPGYKRWISIIDPPNKKPFANTIYYKGLFYIADWDGNLYVCDVPHSCPEQTELLLVASRQEAHAFPQRIYLVESVFGELLQVYRQTRLIG